MDKTINRLVEKAKRLNKLGVLSDDILKKIQNVSDNYIKKQRRKSH